MKTFLLLLFVPCLVWGQDVGTPTNVLQKAEFDPNRKPGVVTQDSTSQIRINCGCGGRKPGPQLFIDGYEMLHSRISDFNPNEIL